jgi:hypothetical protein
VRKALNENPTVQLVVLGIAGVILAILLYTTVLSGDEEPASNAGQPGSTPASSEPATTAPATPAAPAPAAEATPPASGTAPAAPATPSADVGTADDLQPTKGLPKDVLVAYAKNKAVVLIVVDPKAISDRTVRAYTNRLKSRGDVEVFDVDVKDISDYSRITEGVNVSRTPALVVVRPADRTDDVPTATVSYGFRSPKSIDTALEGALYQGGTRSFAPE